MSFLMKCDKCKKTKEIPRPAQSPYEFNDYINRPYFELGDWNEIMFIDRLPPGTTFDEEPFSQLCPGCYQTFKYMTGKNEARSS